MGSWICCFCMWACRTSIPTERGPSLQQCVRLAFCAFLGVACTVYGWPACFHHCPPWQTQPFSINSWMAPVWLLLLCIPSQRARPGITLIFLSVSGRNSCPVLWKCEISECAHFLGREGFGDPSLQKSGLYHLIRRIRWIRGWIPAEFQIAHFIYVLSVKTDLDPPLNPPKARHSSGRPWESLWEGLEELWESFGRLTVQCAHCTVYSLYSVLTVQCAHCTVCSLYSVLTVHSLYSVLQKSKYHNDKNKLQHFIIRNVIHSLKQKNIDISKLKTKNSRTTTIATNSNLINSNCITTKNKHTLQHFKYQNSAI